MPARAACRLAFLHFSRIGPVLIKVPAPAPRHGTWDGRKAVPYRSPCTRHAARCYPTKCLGTLPCHPNQSPFHQSPGPSRLRRPAIALTVNRWPRTHGIGGINPLPFTAQLTPRFQAAALSVEHLDLVVASVAVSSSHPSGQVSMLTVQGSQKVANLGVGDSPALHGRKSKQPTDTPPVCMSVASLWSPSTHCTSAPLQSNLQTHAQSF